MLPSWAVSELQQMSQRSVVLHQLFKDTLFSASMSSHTVIYTSLLVFVLLGAAAFTLNATRRAEPRERDEVRVCLSLNTVMFISLTWSHSSSFYRQARKNTRAGSGSGSGLVSVSSKYDQYSLPLPLVVPVYLYICLSISTNVILFVKVYFSSPAVYT